MERQYNHLANPPWVTVLTECRQNSTAGFQRYAAVSGLCRFLKRLPRTIQFRAAWALIPLK